MPSRALKEGLVWPVGVGGLEMAVTRHQSLGPRAHSWSQI